MNSIEFATKTVNKIIDNYILYLLNQLIAFKAVMVKAFIPLLYNIESTRTIIQAITAMKINCQNQLGLSLILVESCLFCAHPNHFISVNYLEYIMIDYLLKISKQSILLSI